MDEILRELENHGLIDKLVWEGQEYEFDQKGSDWFLIFGIIAFLMIVIALLLGNALLAGIVLLGAFILGTYNHREPKNLLFEINDRGLRIGHEFYPYAKLHSFWVEPTTGVLTIESERMFHPHISMPLGPVSARAAQKYLTDKLPEMRYEGSWADTITTFFGF